MAAPALSKLHASRIAPAIKVGLRCACAACAVVALLAGRASGLEVAYTIQPVPPHGDVAAVTRIEMRIRDIGDAGSLRLQMPAWTPGDYRIRHHARQVERLAATDTAGRSLDVHRVDQDTWEVRFAHRPNVIVRYALPNSKPDRFTQDVCVMNRFAYYEGAPSFLFVEGHTAEPVTLSVRLPRGWKSVVSPLTPDQLETGGKRLDAPDYDTLADSPLLVGDCQTRDFEAGGRMHTIAYFRDRKDLLPEDAIDPVRRIVEWTGTLMGGLPYDRYVIFVDRGGTGGALEHANSCRIAWPGGQSQQLLLTMFSHELFHLWNVKRIRPASFAPLDYIHPPQTTALWFVEGVTEYYAQLALRATGVVDEDAFLLAVGGNLARLRASDGRHAATAEESGRRVWEADNSEGYKVSYYTDGFLAGLCLDLGILHATNGYASLDTVMRDMLARYGAPQPGYPDDGIRDAVVRAGGEAMGPLYDRCCRSTQDLPLQESLGYAGLRLSINEDRVRIERDPDAGPDALAIRQAWLNRTATAAPAARSGTSSAP